MQPGKAVSQGEEVFETPDRMPALRVTLSLSGPATAVGGAIKTASIGDRPFTIGRDPGCDWVVEDQESRISRRHCELRRHGDTLVLIDRSSNGTFVGGEHSRAVKDQPTRLENGIALFLGGARIEVAIGESAAAASADIDDDYFGVGRLPPRQGPAPDDLDLGAPSVPKDDDPFPMQDRIDTLTLDDEAPLSIDAAMRPSGGTTAPPPPREPLGQGVPDTWVDDLDLDDMADEGDPLDDLERMLDGGGGGPAAPEPPKAPPPQEPIDVAPRAGPRTVTPPMEEPAPPPAVAPVRRAEHSPLLDALGFRPGEVPPERAAEIEAEFGRIAIAMAEGLNRMLTQRRDTKIALGIRATQFEVGANPLMWSPDGSAAIRELLEPRSEAYQHGPDAVTHAVGQLQSHQLALVGAVKAAIKVALASFEPRTLEERLEAKGLGQVVPQLRKAQLWDRFVEHYDQFVAQTNEDIRSVLGRELDRLYDPGPVSRPDAPEPRPAPAGRAPSDGLDL